MNPLEFLATAFIRVFGITEPKPAQLRAASWFIVGLLCLVVVVVAAVGLAIHRVLYR